MRRFGAILLPLPCPSIKSEEPAKHCIAQGQTGPERLARARSALEGLTSDQLSDQDPAFLLEHHALAPDAKHTYTPLRGLRRREQYRRDCDIGLFLQIDVFLDKMNHPQRVKAIYHISQDGMRQVGSTPIVFPTCFPGIFDPGQFDTQGTNATLRSRARYPALSPLEDCSRRSP